ncbi:hypothetical protein CEXT_278671 [Caerostris extrusa]|uniref:Secreted protein n=1 Tax=Caerostris extrusa TaxID=172846 RepID=A0AAV4MEK3_CAEEX|nr:hypothetical protein CEXT_278671 [Caerostris extrusa]
MRTRGRLSLTVKMAGAHCLGAVVSGSGWNVTARVARDCYTGLYFEKVSSGQSSGRPFFFFGRSVIVCPRKGNSLLEIVQGILWRKLHASVLG